MVSGNAPVSSAHLRLNQQQEEAIKHSTGPLLIIAGAGTGKTTVITERIKHLITSKIAEPAQILALTFTEKAAQEMQERVDVAMPYGYTQMWISTFHSFCDRVLRNDALHIGLDTRYRLMTEAESIHFFRAHLFDFDLKYFRPLGNPTKFISGMLQHFSRLRDEDTSPSEYLAWAQIKKSKLKNQNDEEKLEIEKWTELAKAYELYEILKAKNSVVDFSDLISNTLKLFRDRPNVLEQYRKQFKYVLVDEFQDTNIAQNELVKLIVGKQGSVTVVADDDQCLPADSLISTPDRDIPINKIKIGDSVVTAVGKGYLSTSKVLHINKVKKKARFLTFTTESGKRLEVTDNHKMFCMIPGRKFGESEGYYIYLMFRQGMGWRLGITDDLAQRLKLERSADKILALKHCSSLEEARFFEVIYSLKYQIPTYPFKPRKRMILTGEWLEKLFAQFDTEKNVQVLAQDLGIDLKAHHFCLGAVVRGNKERIKIRLNMCYRRHRTELAKRKVLLSPKVLHQVVLETSSSSVTTILKEKGIELLKAKKGMMVRKEFTSLLEAGEFATKLQRITGGTLEIGFYVAKRQGMSRRALVMPAGNILKGMSIPVKQGFEVIYEKVIEVKEKSRTEYVYDLEVENTHNFIADGIVVHNSIYKWRGAAVSNVIQFRKSFPKAKIIALTQNYRSTQNILDTSYKVIQNNNPGRLEVKESIDKKLSSARKIKGAESEFLYADRVENEADMVIKRIHELIDKEGYKYSDFAILVRANNYADPFSRALARAGIPYQFLGPGQLFKQDEVRDLVAYLKVLSDFTDSPAFYRIITMEHFGIPARDLAALTTYANKCKIPLFEAAESAEQISLSQEGKEKIKQIIEMIYKHLKRVPRETAGQLVYNFLEDSGILQNITSSAGGFDDKKAQNMAKFFDKLKTFEAEHTDASVFEVVDWIDLSMDLGESPLAADIDWTRENAVNILTIHSAKGLEFPVVFIVNLVSQRFPTMERREQIPIPEELIKEELPSGDYHLQEERRLYYVALTRARDRLYVTAADFYGEGKREKKLSPFVFETFGEVLQKPQDKETEQLSIFDFSPLPSQTSTEELVRKKQRQPIGFLSYSQIEMYNFCPLHYKLKYIYKVPTPLTAPLSFGNTLHLTLREFNERLHKEKLTEKDLFEIYAKYWFREGYHSKSHEEQMKTRGIEYLKSYLASDLYKPDHPPQLLETPFIFPVNGGLKIGGKIDRVDLTKNGIEIIDYKTTDFSSKEIPTAKDLAKNLQLSVYAMAATRPIHAIFGRRPEEVTLSLYFLDLGKKVSTTRTLEDLERAVEEIVKVKEEMEISDFICSGNLFCKSCEYKLYCRVD